jgi:hypothetical protein
MQAQAMLPVLAAIWGKVPTPVRFGLQGLRQEGMGWQADSVSQVVCNWHMAYVSHVMILCSPLSCLSTYPAGSWCL